MATIIALLLHYRYVIILPIAILEGPIITIIGGFLVSMGVLNPFLVYILVVTGDALGDAGCYIIGRWGSPLVDKYGHKIGVTPKKIHVVKEYFHAHRRKALFFSKVLHGIGFTGLIVAGTLRIPYRKFFTVCFLTTAAQSLILLLIGILFGHAYTTIGQYLNYYTAGSIIIGVLFGGYLVIRKFNILVEKQES
jgi:membrane-associated protein